MNVVVCVCEADLRGVPFRQYESTLGELIGETYPVDEIEVRLAAATAVEVDGLAGTDDAFDIRAMAQQITDPAVRDGYFG